MSNKFKIEVVADSGGKWAGNARVYDTFEEGKAAALDLAGRWMLVTRARVVEYSGDTTIEETVVF